VSEQDSTNRPAEDEDVEAHGKKRVMASDEAKDETEPEADREDDVELHGRSKKVM
jgi:hypothetical protein